MSPRYRLHPLSCLAGVLVALVSAAVIGMAPAPTPAMTPIRIAGTVGVHGIPQAHDMVRIVEGTPFVVPPRQMLVLTALASTTSIGEVGTVIVLRFDGESALKAVNTAPGMMAIPPGLAAAPGATVSVIQNQVDDTSIGTAFGYLASLPQW